MTARLSIFHKGLILILSPILAETLVVVSLYSVLFQTENQRELEAKFRARSASVVKINSLNFDACLLLFAMGVPGSRVPRRFFYDKVSQLRYQSRFAATVMSSDAELSKIYAPIRAVADKITDSLVDLSETIRSGSSTLLMSQLDETISKVVGMLTETSGKVDQLVRYNDLRIAESQKLMDNLRFQHRTILQCAIAGNILLAIILMTYFNQAIIKRLRQIRKNTELLASGQALPDGDQGSDEIALLDQSFHAMQTALKETRQKESLLFENAADVICIVNHLDEFVYVNPASQRNWQWAPQDLLGKSISMVIAPEQTGFVQDSLNKSRESGIDNNFESRVLCADGRAVEYSWSVYVEPVERRLYCVAHDISAQKELERARERYIAIVSQDLKKPILSIAESFNAVKQLGELPDKARAKFEGVSNNLKRLLLLVEELGHRKSFWQEGNELEIKKRNLNELVERALLDVDGVARSKKIKITSPASEATQLMIDVDGNRLIQVLVNLLSNAVKFSQAGAEINVEVEDRDDFVVINVCDHGRGIPEEQLERIFDKFSQVDAADGKRATGTGLGLTICKQIVEQHHGEIGVRSTVGEGSTFWLRLPRVNAGCAPHDESPGAGDAGTSSLQTESMKFPQKLRASAELVASRADSSSKKQDGSSKQHTKKLSGLRNVPLFLKGAVLIGIPLCFEVVLAGTLASLLMQSETLTKSAMLERQIANDANNIAICYRKMGIVLLGPNSSNVVATFKKNKSETARLAKHLRKLLKDDPDRSKRIDRVVREIKECNLTMERSYYRTKELEADAPSGKYAKIGIALRFLRPMGNLTRELQDLITDASKREALNPEKQKNLTKMEINLLTIGLFSNFVLGLWLARLFSDDIRQRLELVAANTRRLAAEQELLPTLSGKDEIAVLDLSFHQAAGQLKAARKRERTLFDNSKEIICSFCQGSKLTEVNPAAPRLLGVSKQELLESNFLDFVCAEDREITSKNLSSQSDLEYPRSFENRVRRNDGSVSYLHWSAMRAADQEDTFFCVAHDISELKEAERLRNEFLSIVSHDLRTPLGAILITTTMLEEGAYGAIPKDGHKKLASVASDVNRLLELINDLLDIEKLEAGMMAFSLQQVELSQLAHEFAERSRGLLESKRIKLTLDAPDEAMLSLDKDRFLQALANLLQNAVDRSALDSGIDILAKHESDFCSVVIRDHSPPLDSRKRQEIFDRFAISTAITGKGSSLSIPLSKSIIKSHGGTLTLGEGLESGNEFIVKMPIMI